MSVFLNEENNAKQSMGMKTLEFLPGLGSGEACIFSPWRMAIHNHLDNS